MKRASQLSSVAVAVGLSSVSAQAAVVKASAAGPDLSTLQSAIVAAGREGDLAGAEHVTGLAPNSAACKALPPAGAFQEMQADPAKLRDALLYHAVDGAISADQLGGALVTATALNGKPLKYVLNDGFVAVADKRATNFIVHVINDVLLARD